MTATVKHYLYTYAAHEFDAELCSLGSRSLLFPGAALRSDANALLHPRRLDPSRSPYLKLRMAVELEAGSPWRSWRSWR